MKLLKKIVKHEDGQVLVLVALLMVVLVGFAALIVDVGAMYLTKTNMQNAADAAALAGAQDLPNANTAKNTAKTYAVLNGAEQLNTTVTTPYNGDSTMIKVVITKNVQYSFAKVLGFINGNVSALAVAKRVPVWNGEALPFLNLTNRFFDGPDLIVWTKEAPGTFGSIWKDDRPYDPLTTSFTIDIEDGFIEAKDGKVANIADEVGDIFALHRTQYIFSLSEAAIISGDYDGKIDNKQKIPLKDLVLLQVSFISYVSKKSLSLTLEKIWDINSGEYPTEFLNDVSKGTSGLVE